jgi:hypothetical protein
MKPVDSINLSDVLAHVMHEFIRRYPLFHHIDLNRVQVCVSSNRSGRGGLYGNLVPLRFRDGSPVVRHRGRVYRMPAYEINGVEQLYLVYFFMPRFFDLPLGDKVKVLAHELYHISADFNGDIRRMGRTRAAHGHSRERFDSFFMKEVRDFIPYISGTPYANFLNLDTRGINGTFRAVKAMRLKMPRPFPVSDERAP